MRAALLALLVIGTAPPVAAQLPSALGAGLGGASIRLRAGDSTAARSFAGMAVGGRLRIGSRAAALEASYLQGTLDPDTGTAPPRELVDGSLLVALSPLRWLTLKGGPHLRAWVFGGGTQRWVWWEAHARADGSLVDERLRAHVEMWTALSGEVNVPAGAGAAMGGEAGLTVRLARVPVWARLTYAIDRARFAGSDASEMMETLRVSLMLGGR